jgi:phytoene dehydrogenase-like protein
MREAPRFVKGDAAGEIEPPGDGRWTEGTREAYADRIERRLAAHIENWAEIKRARRAYSPTDLEAMNINLVGGDPYGGACAQDQFFLWRPFKSSVNHRTYIPNVYTSALRPIRARGWAGCPASFSRRRSVDFGRMG